MKMLNLIDETSSFSQPLAFTLLALFLILLYKWLSSASPTTNKASLPPSPRKLPIIGNFHQLGEYPNRSLQALSHRHGPIMLLHFGSVPVLVVSSAEVARKIMKTHDLTFSDRPTLLVTRKLLYNEKDIGFAPHGEYWRQVKSVAVLNLLSNKRVRSFRAVREEEVKSMINEIRNSSSSSAVLNLSEMFARLTNDVVCRVALGRKYSGDEAGKKFKQLLWDFGELLGTFNIGDYIPWLSWWSRVNGLEAKLDQVANDLDRIFDGVLQEHKDQSSMSKDDDQKDFVDVLLQIQKENLTGVPLDTISMKALLLDMFAAGTDTTYTALEWAMTEVLRHPIVMNKLKNEVGGLVGNRKDITEDDLVEMHYLKAVFKETLRLHPPIPLLVPRQSTQDVELDGYNIKAKTQVIVNAWQIGRDPNLYDKPEDFDPDRFLNSAIDYKGHDFQLIPFGAGRRICPGFQFAMSVNEIALANLVHNFDWTLPGGQTGENLDMTDSVGLTMHRKYPLKAVATPYSC